MSWNQNKRIAISAEANYSFGSNIHLESNQGKVGVVFRDSGGEAYFSGADATGDVVRVLIYNREHRPSGNGNLIAQIAWSPGGGQALLLINKQPQAVLDFTARRAYCRTNIPVPKSQWADTGQEWSEDALKFF